ncbi:hypothetical protein [Gallaecimonas xiamenensis]|uniref:Uncharacterized protein n=1 Tax=Gallaecimonas xiamenensis 3-C-1 TaxID=745411 RepID=K2K9N2_9GAMM|nr:hypothetical protein [Gallaecimonas xiamenensis]EKE74025.1 hypothetical protein B3C1_09408 [Gallaecimonas xiamenensis 3-C-1]
MTPTSSERRYQVRDLRQNFEVLDELQLDAVYALMKVGARLLFVRDVQYMPLAILEHGGHYITVDLDGRIDLHPALSIRSH